MNQTIIQTPRINNIFISGRNNDQALSYAHSIIEACPPGEVICITDESSSKNRRLFTQLEKLLKRSNKSDNSSVPVVRVSATKYIVDGKLSTKALTLETLSSVRLTPYTQKNIHDVQDITLQMALEDALISRKTRYVLFANTHKAFNEDSDHDWSDRTLSAWKFLAQSTGIVLVFDHVEKTNTKNASQLTKGNEYALGN